MRDNLTQKTATEGAAMDIGKGGDASARSAGVKAKGEMATVSSVAEGNCSPSPSSGHNMGSDWNKSNTPKNTGEKK